VSRPGIGNMIDRGCAGLRPCPAQGETPSGDACRPRQMYRTRQLGRQIFSRCLPVVLAMVGGLLPSVELPSAAADTAPNAIHVRAPMEVPVTTIGETFFDSTLGVDYGGTGLAVISANSDGTGPVVVDDAFDITITHPDNTQSSFSYDFSNGCRPLVASGPFDISADLANGHNSVRIVMRDVCGGSDGSGDVWLVVAQQPSVNSSLRVLPTSGVPGTEIHASWTCSQGAGTNITVANSDGSSALSNPLPVTGNGTDYTAGFTLAAPPASYVVTASCNASLTNQITLTIGAPKSLGPGATYVALGDSYSSGEGQAPYIYPTDVSCAGVSAPSCKVLGITNGNQCHRSQYNAYPDLALAGAGAPDRTFRACSGDVIDDFYNARGFDQLAWQDDSKLYDPSEPAQLGWLGTNTKYVTLSISGNDVGFVPILTACTFTSLIRRGNLTPPQSFTDSCNAAILAGMQTLPSVKDALENLYTAALAEAPNAQIRVLNYPLLFPSPDTYVGYNHQACKVSGFGAYVMNQQVTRFRELNMALDATILQAIQAVQSATGGTRLQLADVETWFGNHAISCGDIGPNTPRPWVNAALIHLSVLSPASRASFHPTSTGQCQMAVLVDHSFGWSKSITRC
jgi:hypothetical protein